MKTKRFEALFRPAAAALCVGLLGAVGAAGGIPPDAVFEESVTEAFRLEGGFLDEAAQLRRSLQENGAELRAAGHRTAREAREAARRRGSKGSCWVSLLGRAHEGQRTLAGSCRVDVPAGGASGRVRVYVSGEGQSRQLWAGSAGADGPLRLRPGSDGNARVVGNVDFRAEEWLSRPPGGRLAIYADAGGGSTLLWSGYAARR
ncbi:MAG: hypothetical protein HY928_01890 [Elusimicrobia bacterium]|nr:hypothetical protein [Elusimicrobiota bacterium]